MSGPTRFTVVAGTDKKPLGLTNKDAHVSFFFTSTLCYKPNVSFYVYPQFSCANILVNVIGIYELVCVPAPGSPLP